MTKISINLDEDKQECNFTIQERGEGGSFGETIKKTYGFDFVRQFDLVSFVKNLLSNTNTMEQLPTPTTKESVKENPTYEEPKFLINKKALLIAVGIFVLFIVTSAFASFKDQQLEIVKLKAEVESLRTTRNAKYDLCIASCLDDRKPRDEKVTKKLEKIQELESQLQ